VLEKVQPLLHPASASLLEAWMPDPSVAAAYRTIVAAPPERVYEALLNTDFGRHPLVALLMGLRTIPAAVVAPRATWRRLRESRRRGPLPLRALLGQDFALLEEQPPIEIVLGLTGRFWTASGCLVPTDPATFRQPPPPGMARAAWNFRLDAVEGGRTRLSTETRVTCSDPATLRKFRMYWRLVAPGSGLIRWAILRRIRRGAEAAVV